MTMWQSNMAAEAAKLAAKAAMLTLKLGSTFVPAEARKLRAEVGQLEVAAQRARQLSQAEVIGA